MSQRAKKTASSIQLDTKCILSEAPFSAVVRRGAGLPSLSPLVNTSRLTAVYAVPITQRQIAIVVKAATFLDGRKVE